MDFCEYVRLCLNNLLFSVTPQGEEAPLVRDEEDLFIIQQSSEDFLQVKKAEYVGYRKLTRGESELLYMPSFQTGIMNKTNLVYIF